MIFSDLRCLCCGTARGLAICCQFGTRDSIKTCTALGLGKDPVVPVVYHALPLRTSRRLATRRPGWLGGVLVAVTSQSGFPALCAHTGLARSSGWAKSLPVRDWAESDMSSEARSLLTAAAAPAIKVA